MKKILLIVLGVLALLFGGAAGYYQYRFNTHPDLAPYAQYYASPVSLTGDPSSGVTVTFVGVATLLFSDGTTSLLTDGFFSRPNAFNVLTSDIEPDRAAIERGLARAGLENKKLAAVMVLHSHYDHVMDAPIVAEKTGAMLLGSESTANVGRGLQLPEKQIRVVTPGEAMRYGAFTVTFYENRHYPLPEWVAEKILGNQIETPLVPPCDAFDYKEGKTYSILIEHPSGKALVQGSAGYLPGALKNVRAETIFLGLGGAGALPDQEFEAYLRETVFTVGARRVFPIHWDDMFRSIDEEQKAAKDFPGSMDRLLEAAEDALDVQLLPVWKPVRLD